MMEGATAAWLFIALAFGQLIATLVCALVAWLTYLLLRKQQQEAEGMNAH